jgi:hypothetical protein
MLNARLQACLCTLHCLNCETSVSTCEKAHKLMNPRTATLVSTCACIHTQHATETRHASAALDIVCHHMCNILLDSSGNRCPWHDLWLPSPVPNILFGPAPCSFTFATPCPPCLVDPCSKVSITLFLRSYRPHIPCRSRQPICLPHLWLHQSHTCSIL